MHADDRRVVVVLAAIVERQGRFLVSRRLKGTHLEGLWEFPGGKCEPDESHESCLSRELKEELGVTSSVGLELLVTEHHYPDRTIRLHFRECLIEGEPHAVLGQELRWVTRDELRALPLPPADEDLVALLTGQSRSR